MHGMFLFLNNVYVYVYASVYMSSGEQERPLDPLELVTGGCELTDVAAGTEPSNSGYCNSNSNL